MQNEQELKEMVRQKYSEIALQDTGSNKASCCGAGGCSTEVYNIMTDDYSNLQGYHPEADLGLGCGLPTQFAKIKKADVVIDLVFEKSHTVTLMDLLPKHVIINSVEYTLPETNSFFVRINAWPTFLKSNLVEAAALSGSNRKMTEDVFLMFNKKIEWVQDEIGFVTPKVVSMIINEAFFALEEEVSTKDQIDIAMKLGTNYPYGPFEWAERIGLRRIASLLTKLCSENLRYQPSELLLQQNAV